MMLMYRNIMYTTLDISKGILWYTSTILVLLVVKLCNCY